MKIGDKIFLTDESGNFLRAQVIGYSNRYFGERRQDERAVKDTHLIQLESGLIMLDLRCHKYKLS